MENKVLFTDSVVANFCKATVDDNPIHDPVFMYNQNKGVVVPGMLLFSTIVNLLHRKTDEYFNYYKLIFGNVICTNEPIDLGFETKGEHNYLYAINGHDMFSTKNERSVVLKNIESKVLDLDGIVRAMPFHKTQLETFRELTNSLNNTLSDFLFTIAYASAALFKAIREPITEVETEINRLLNKTINPDQVSPFYQTLEIFRVNQHAELNSEGTIEYNIRFDREKANKTYIAQVTCMHNNQCFYQSVYRLVAIPDKLIMRMVKDRNKG
ncbi:hypothetical protein [Tenuifilum osseticum]|uniref:hypothetical protein n=1 Tax=Tenuifilum osseticum TaxID=3374723 RepID=UPI0034E46B2A